MNESKIIIDIRRNVMSQNKKKTQ